LRLTTAKYYTPKGRSIHGIGITPDIVVDIPKAEAKAPGPGEQQAAAPQPKTGEQQLEMEIKQPKEKPIGEQDGPGVDIGPRDIANPAKDIQLQRAIEILKATRILEKPATEAKG
jgi:carboxyl-terminal processing protease